jgi:aminopeptidase N
MMRRAVLLTATCLVPILIAGTARAEPKFDFDKTPGQLPKTVVPDEYQIDLVPDLVKLTLTGHETIAVNFRQPEATATLDDTGLTIGHAALEDGTAATVTMDAPHQTATLHFPHAIAAGRHTITIDYTGPIPNTPAGIYYNDYRTARGPAKRMLVTQFETTDARRMFPGWDEPVFKAKFRLSAVLPKDYAAISNMPIVGTTPAGPGLNKVQFDTSPRMSTYLLALIAGDLAAVRSTADNTKLAAWAPTGEESQAQYSLDVEHNVLPFYNQYFGVPYPLPKLDLIAIPGNYEAGAMENWGAITFIDDAMLFDPKTSAARTRETIHLDTAHEMAHQWSGDLVTMAWWNDIWLNEGFATWMEFKATDHFNPSWQIWPRQHEAREDAMSQDAQPTTHAIQQPIPTESEANTAFDQISYQKGSQIIRMIEDWITPEKFQQGMQAYMKAHQYNSATSADLWDALGHAAGRDVATMASGFTDQPGIPLVRVARHCAGGHASLTLTQDRFAIHDPKAAKLSWIVPVTLGVPDGEPTHVVIDGAPVTVPLAACDTPEKVNFGENGYYRTQYDTASLKPLVAALPKFGAADRANLLGDQFEMFLAGRASLAAYLDMLPQLRDETNIAVWEDTLSRLRFLDALARGAAVRAPLRAYARTLVRPEFDRLGWDAKPGESFLDSLLRPEVISALGRFEDPEIIAQARRRFADFIKNPATLPPDLRAPVLNIVGHRADQETYAELGKLAATATSTEEKLRYFTALASAEDPKLIAETVQLASSGVVPNGRVAMMIGMASRNSDNPDEVWRQVQPRQKAIRAHLTEDSQNFLLPAAAFSSHSTAVARALMADPSVKANPGATIIAKRAADAILTQAELQQRAVPALTAWLAAKK